MSHTIQNGTSKPCPTSGFEAQKVLFAHWITIQYCFSDKLLVFEFSATTTE